MLKVIKRDNRKVDFDKNKIIKAILAAFKEVDGEASAYAISKADNIANYILEYAEKENKELTIEEIQDLVEKGLMSTKRKDVARAYVTYRNNRTREREKNSIFIKNVSEKLSASNVENQNANMDEKSFGGRIGAASSEVMKKYALDYCMSDMARNNHLNNEIYIHDLDHYAVGDHNCFESNTQFLTTKGLKTFNDFSDGDEIEIISHTGQIRKAKIHQYGEQQLYKFELKRNRTTYFIEATDNHRWLKKDGSWTNKLAVGDYLAHAPNIWEDFNFDLLSLEDKKYWCYGFTMGDGTLIYRNGKKSNKYSKVKLCKEKSKYLYRFQECGWGLNCKIEEPEIMGITFNKEIPDFDNLPYSTLVAFIHGLYDADGNHSLNQNGKPIYGIQFSNKILCDFIEKYSESVGLYISRKVNKTGQKTNYGVRKYTIEYNFVPNPKKYNYKVISKIPTKKDIVWCLEVEEDKSFILHGGIVTGNCLSIPFDKLLAEGFNTRQTDVRPAQSVSTAFQLVAVIFQLQSLQQFGGVSATHLDWTMVPYVRKSFSKHFKDGLKYFHQGSSTTPVFTDIERENTSIEGPFYKAYDESYKYALDKTEQEVRQAVEGMYHNLNTLQSRSGNQLPFTSINYGTCTLPEGRMITKALLEVSIEGIGKLHKTSIFPCGIFQCMKGVNRKPGDPNYDLFRLALRSTVQRLYPNYANVDWSGNAGYDVNDPRTYFSTMGCRTANGFDINGMGQQKDGRGNICPVTIILPTLAMEVKEKENKDFDDKDEFIALLLDKIDEAKDMLIERFEYICSQSPDSAKFMYENGVMEGYIPEEGIRSALKHGTLAIGQLGLAEALQILIGTDHTTKEGMELAKRIEKVFKDRCAEFKEKYKLNFGVYYTPAENLCYTAMKKFKEKYGEIPNVSDKEFFTNSIHVPVWRKMSIMKKIDIESQLTGYSSAGCITYIELDGTVKHNLDALETVVNYAMDKDIPYFAINVPNDTCLDCGYTDELNDTCPMCGSKNIQRLRRVTGYLTGSYLDAFNKGKIQETEMRVKHNYIDKNKN